MRFSRGEGGWNNTIGLVNTLPSGSEGCMENPPRESTARYVRHRDPRCPDHTVLWIQFQRKLHFFRQVCLTHIDDVSVSHRSFASRHHGRPLRPCIRNIGKTLTNAMSMSFDHVLIFLSLSLAHSHLALRKRDSCSTGFGMCFWKAAGLSRKKKIENAHKQGYCRRVDCRASFQ